MVTFAGYAPLYLAKEKGFFGDLNVELRRIEEFPSIRAAMEASSERLAWEFGGLAVRYENQPVHPINVFDTDTVNVSFVTHSSRISVTTSWSGSKLFRLPATEVSSVTELMVFLSCCRNAGGLPQEADAAYPEAIQRSSSSDQTLYTQLFQT
jgi:hypothetical protein